MPNWSRQADAMRAIDGLDTIVSGVPAYDGPGAYVYVDPGPVPLMVMMAGATLDGAV